MSLSQTLPAALLEAALTGLAAIFLAAAGGDMANARQAAADALGDHHPRTEDELRLATIIIGFSFRAIEALAQSAARDLPLAHMLRLHGSAASLSREAAKAERRLVQLRKLPQPAVRAVSAAPEPAQPEPKIEPAVAPVTGTPILHAGKVAQAARANGVTWTKAYDDRQRELRIAASVKKAEARVAAQTVVGLQGAAPEHGAMAAAI